MYQSLSARGRQRQVNLSDSLVGQHGLHKMFQASLDYIVRPGFRGGQEVNYLAFQNYLVFIYVSRCPWRPAGVTDV